MKIYNGITDMIGNTPLMRIKKYCLHRNIKADICVKLECHNPAGSAKDRVALAMIEDAENKGLLKEGSVIIEPTSGNTGIGLAAIGRAKGYKVILTMPDTMSRERRMLLAAYGAELVLTPGSEGMGGAVKRAEELAASISGSFIAGQFDNPANPYAHYTTTGPEIWRDTDGKVGALVAGIGTGGTLSGSARYLKEMSSDIRVIGFEPAESPLISTGKAGPHKIQGIGANFIPDNYDPSVCDLLLQVSGAEAYETARELAETEGILVGVSGAACVCAAEKATQNGELDGKLVVCVLPDSGERYLSTPNYFSESV